MRILSTAIEELSANESNHASAARMKVRGMIRSLSIEEVNGHVYINSRMLHGSHMIDLSLELSEYGDILDHYCSCPFHHQEDACGHVIALCQYLVQCEFKLPYHLDITDEQPQKMHADANRKNKMIEHQKIRESHSWLREESQKMMQWLQVNTKNEQVCLYMDLEPEISFQGSLLLSARIGYPGNKQYIIRDLSRFLQEVNIGALHTYGKNTQILQRIDSFDDASRTIIAFFRQLEQRGGMTADKRYFRLSDVALDLFSALLRDLPKGYCSCRQESAMLRLGLQIEEQRQQIQISMRGIVSGDKIIFNALAGEQAVYALKQDQQIFYCYEADQEKRVLRLYQRLLTHHVLLLDPQDFALFYHTYLERLKDYISWTGNIDVNNIAEIEDKICLYLDLDASLLHLTAKLELVYGEQTVNAFSMKKGSSVSMDALAIKEFLMSNTESVDEGLLYLKQDQHPLDQAEMLQKALQERCEIYISNQLYRIRRPRHLSLSVGVRIENDLVNLELDAGGIEMDELADILRNYRRRKKYYKLKNGEILDLQDDSIRETDELFQKLQLQDSQLQQKEIVLPGYRLYNIDALSEEQHIVQYDRSEIARQNDRLMKKQTFAVPEEFKEKLRDYQRDGFQWLKTLSAYGFGGLLADDMGLGKTIQVLAYFRSEQEKGKQHLVVCPASLLFNWNAEAARFAPSLKCTMIYGGKSERKQKLREGADSDLLITSYDYLKRDMDLYGQYRFDTVILDEAQYISNPRTKNAQAVKLLNCRQRFALSGTPIENNLTELWSIYDFLLPGYLYSHSYFSAVYERAIIKEQDEAVISALQRLVRPFLLRRTKKEVLEELPDKEEHVLYFHLDKKERALYAANAANVRDRVESEMNGGQDKIVILSLIMRLRQICQDARLIYENVDWVSSKLRGCMELIQSCIRNHKKVLLFSSFTSMLELIRQELEKESISYYLLTGSVQKEKRQEYVDRFQQDDTPVFMISLKAGGTGLNLTAAEVVIHFDPWWNISAQNQATDRAYRIGQHNNVQVYNLIMKDTIEERIQTLQAKKKDLAELFVNTQNTNILRSLSKEELLELFS